MVKDAFSKKNLGTLIITQKKIKQNLTSYESQNYLKWHGVFTLLEQNMDRCLKTQLKLESMKGKKKKSKSL